jgi:GAF domain-containing protein
MGHDKGEPVRRGGPAGRRKPDGAIDVSGHLAALADHLEQHDIAELFAELVASCVELFPVDGAAILLVGQDGSLEPVACSSERLRALELAHLQTGDPGPGAEVVATGAALHIEDLDAPRPRWPSYTRAARSLGVRSLWVLPLRFGVHTLGVLKLLSSSTPGLTVPEQRTAQRLAELGTASIVEHFTASKATTLTAQLQKALDSRVVIEQAKGVLAAYGGLDMPGAFEALRGYARRHSRRLAELASAVVETSSLAHEVVAEARGRKGA